jgi:hypothetical protein
MEEVDGFAVPLVPAGDVPAVTFARTNCVSGFAAPATPLVPVGDSEMARCTQPVTVTLLAFDDEGVVCAAKLTLTTAAEINNASPTLFMLNLLSVKPRLVTCNPSAEFI